MAEQTGKYRRALEKCLDVAYHGEPHVIEVICLVGSPPEPQDRPEIVEKILAADNARFMTYDNLIAQSRNSYRDYLDADKKITYIQEIIDSI